MNGVIERAIQEVNKRARTMLFEANLLYSLWCYATEHSVHLHNRVPTSALPFRPLDDSPVGVHITPFAAYRNRFPDLSKLKVFGSQAYITFPKDLYPQKFKLKMREEEGIQVGLISNYIAKILNRKTLQVRLSTTTKVDEYRFLGIEDTTNVNSLPLRPLITARGPQSTIQGENNRMETSQTRNRDSGSRETPQIDSRSREAMQQNEESDSEESTTPRNERLRISRFSRPIKAIKKAFSYAVALAATQGGNDDEEAFTILGSTPLEGISIKQALKDDAPNQEPTIYDKLISLSQNGTYIICQGEPKDRRLVSTKQVLKYKYSIDRTIQRYKVRLVARGFEQEYSLDYNETFASVVRYTTLRLLASLAIANDYKMEQMDIDIAFLIPPLKEDVYIEIPQFLKRVEESLRGRTKPAYLKLRKSLYGLK